VKKTMLIRKFTHRAGDKGVVAWVMDNGHMPVTSERADCIVSNLHIQREMDRLVRQEAGRQDIQRRLLQVLLSAVQYVQLQSFVVKGVIVGAELLTRIGVPKNRIDTCLKVLDAVDSEEPISG
jgi:hypothetical protein